MEKKKNSSVPLQGLASNFTGVRQSGKTILMKVTSRERPDILLETVRLYIDMASNSKDMVWLFSFDQDDLSYYDNRFLKSLFEVLGVTTDGIKLTEIAFGDRLYKGNIDVQFGTSTGKIEAINRDLDIFKPEWDILLNISDDQRPIVKGYDDIIRRTMPDHLDASLWFSDGQPRVNTQEIIGRKYYERFGYIYHPDFKSLWCDNLSTDLAIYQGKCIKSRQQIVKHYHPAWGGNESFKRDQLYDRNDKFWNQDEATYKRLVAAGLENLIPKS